MRRLALLALLALGACYDVPDAFTCLLDEQCNTGDPVVHGHCELQPDGDSGYCSVDVPASICPSKRQYVHYAGPRADECVAPEAELGAGTGNDLAAAD